MIKLTEEQITAALAGSEYDETGKDAHDQTICRAKLIAHAKHNAAAAILLEAMVRDLLDAIAFQNQSTLKSIDRDNMEFEVRLTCFQVDKLAAAYQRTKAMLGE